MLFSVTKISEYDKRQKFLNYFAQMAEMFQWKELPRTGE